MAGCGTVEYGTVRYVARWCGAVRYCAVGSGAVWCGAGFCGPWCWLWRIKYSSFGFVNKREFNLRNSCRRTDPHSFPQRFM